MECIAHSGGRFDTAVDGRERTNTPDRRPGTVGLPGGRVGPVRKVDAMDAEAVLAEWGGRTGEFSPGYYAYYGPNDTSERIRQILETTVDHEAAILELGCSSGRHLSHLFDHGYGEVSGVEINGEALDVMESSFPDLASAGTFYFDAIEDVITAFEDRQFDAVYSVETLQHIHPDNDWVFEEIARITDDLLVTVEIEEPTAPTGDSDAAAGSTVKFVNDDFPLYYRNWNRIFTEFGLTEVETAQIKRDRLRQFRRPDR